MAQKPAVHIVDDDASVRDALTILFKAAGLPVENYDNAEAFLERMDRLQTGCLLVDVRLPGASGLDLHRAVLAAELPLAVIVMSGHGDIPMAVTAVREGALDFIEKPFNPTALVESVRRALAQSDTLREQYAWRAALRARFATLTPREQDVMRLVVNGLPTKTVAARLEISTRTAETHRGRVMEKMGARTLSDLVRYSVILERELGKIPA
jgi:two-component system response regulator FixJ